MKLKYILILSSIFIFNEIYGFPNQPHPFKKKMRINFRIIKRRTSRNILHRIKAVADNQDEIVDKSVSLFYDNMLTDMLGIAKVYNLINDETKSYYYIILYEFAWFAFKVLKININNQKFRTDSDDSQILFDQLIINIMLYISFKNILFQNVYNIISSKYM